MRASAAHRNMDALVQIQPALPTSPKVRLLGLCQCLLLW